MGITVNGNIIVKGDQVFDGGVKIVKNYGKADAEPEALTEEMLKDKIESVMNLIEKDRYWFPVCKYMMWEGLVAEDDFDGALALIQKHFPDVAFDPKDLSTKMNVGCFRKSLAEWVDDEDAPVHNKTFNKYKSIAEAMYHI